MTLKGQAKKKKKNKPDKRGSKSNKKGVSSTSSSEPASDEVCSNEDADLAAAAVVAVDDAKPEHEEVEEKEMENTKAAAAEAPRLERRSSLRRKLGALIKASADLPAAINRGLQPIRRSMSFGKDLDKKPPKQHSGGSSSHKAKVSSSTSSLLTVAQQHQLQAQPQNTHNSNRARSMLWYHSLSSLAEHNNEGLACSEDDDADSRVFLEDSKPSENNEPVLRRRPHSVYEIPFTRHSDHYDSSIDLSKPPCEAISLPVLTDEIDGNEHDQSAKSRGWMEQQVKNGRRDNLSGSTRNLSVLRGFGFKSKKRNDSVSVRSRSLTQLDALGSSMLDAGAEHQTLGSGSSSSSSPQQPQHQQQQQQQQLPQQSPHHHHHHHHQLHHHHSQTFGEPSPSSSSSSTRFLVPSAASADGTRPNRTRHKLSRSQVSSSEYFSVSFEVGDEQCSIDREEFLPATKGAYLADILSAACERRGIDLSRVDVLLDTFSAPLSLHTTETSCLGGKHLRITAKDEKSSSRSGSQRGSQNVSLRKTGGSYRGRSGGRFFSVSTEDSSVDSEVGSAAAAAAAAAAISKSNASGAATSSSTTASSGLKASKQRWSGFFTNTKGTKMEMLVEQLNLYTKHGVPKLPEHLQPYELAFSDDALFSLEGDWRDIVEGSEMLSEKQQQQQTALWELAQTEAAYIKTLKVVTDLFMACLCGLQASNILVEVDRTKLFSNISEIYAANREFWTECVYAMLHAARATREPLDPGYLLPGFESFERVFAPYTRYCSEQSRCQQYCRDRFNDNDVFTAYLVWCETQKDCNRLRLLDILVKPMQRITKYSLLLKAIQKHTELEEQRLELNVMIKLVDGFVASVNAALRRCEDAARLLAAAARLDSYEAVESRDEELERLIKLHSSLDLINSPMPGCPRDALRTLMREGDCKLKDAATSKTEVHLLLLTDMLLVCKQSAKSKASSSSASSSSSAAASSSASGLKVIRQPYVVDRIRMYELKEPSNLGMVYLNEYGTAAAALVLSVGEPKLAKLWMESIRKAQQQLAQYRQPVAASAGAAGVAAGGGAAGGSVEARSTLVSRQPSTYLGEVDYDIDEICCVAEGGMPCRTPRGSSRASRVSSLAHSHSGSVEMEGASPSGSNFLPSYNQSRNVSVENQEPLPPRASSVSSEEGVEAAAANAHAAALAAHNQRQQQIRRSLLSKSPTPNTLSVQVPAYSSLGQSLPNLTLATSPQTSTVSPTPPSSLLIVPQITKSKDTLLSPGHRGISYPPPSPPRGALRRAFAIPQSRNPPLIKTRHVNASVGSGGSGIQTVPLQMTISLDTESLDERRRGRLEPSQRMASTSSIAEEKK